MKDHHLLRVREMTDLNKMFEAYLYHSFLYYCLSTNEITDHDYDDLCMRLLDRYSEIEHPQKGLVDESDFSCGTGYRLTGKYPKWVWDLARANGHEIPPEGLLERTYAEDLKSRESIIGHVTLVGSRETPSDVLRLMRGIGQHFCDTNFRGRSGGAPGADSAFYQGASNSRKFKDIGFDVFLPNSWSFNKEEFGFLKPRPSEGIYDATTFTDTYESATQLAERARGSFYGLGDVGIQLHIRNVFQVLGVNLRHEEFSKCVVFWAKPTGTKGRVEGGTNTAVQVAIQHDVPVYNLYLPNTRRHFEQLLEEHTEHLWW